MPATPCCFLSPQNDVANLIFYGPGVKRRLSELIRLPSTFIFCGCLQTRLFPLPFLSLKDDDSIRLMNNDSVLPNEAVLDCLGKYKSGKPNPWQKHGVQFVNIVFPERRLRALTCSVGVSCCAKIFVRHHPKKPEKTCFFLSYVSARFYCLLYMHIVYIKDPSSKKCCPKGLLCICGLKNSFCLFLFSHPFSGHFYQRGKTTNFLFTL